MSSETIETLEYRDHASVEESTAVEEPAVISLWDDIWAVFEQCCVAGEQFCTSVMNWAPWKVDGQQRAASPETGYSCVDAVEREIQLTAAVEREINLSNAMQGLQAGF